MVAKVYTIFLFQVLVQLTLCYAFDTFSAHLLQFKGQIVYSGILVNKTGAIYTALQLGWKIIVCLSSSR